MQNEANMQNLQVMLRKDVEALTGKDKELFLHYAKTLGGMAINFYKVVDMPKHFPGPFYIVEVEVTVAGAASIAYCSIGASHGNYPYPKDWKGEEKGFII